jgi:SAM-dependent methyltransferase
MRAPPQTSARSALRRRLADQFHHPHGMLGRLAGLILANRKSNRLRNAWTVGLLDIQPTDSVLELGFGPGVSIAAASRLAPEGCVIGIDHSASMLRAASRRNRSAIQSGRVVLHEASLEKLPEFELSFDKIFGVNALQFVSEPLEVLSAIRERMASGARIAITQQSRRPNATDRDSIRAVESVGELLEQVGFGSVQIETLPLQPVCAACVLAVAS